MSVLRQYPQDRITRFCFSGVAKAIRQVDDDIWLQVMLEDIIEWRDEGCASMSVALPLVIAGKMFGFAEGLHLLDGAVALDDGQIVSAKGVEQAGEFCEELWNAIEKRL